MAFLLQNYLGVATVVGGVCSLSATAYLARHAMAEEHRPEPKTVEDCLKQTTMDVGTTVGVAGVGMVVGVLAGLIWPVTIYSLGANFFSFRKGQKNLLEQEKTH